MRLHKVTINNFRKLRNCDIYFRDATFLIGQNNTGKSSVFDALSYLHSQKNISKEDYLKYYDPYEDDYKYEHHVTIVAEYRDVPEEALSWMGFKGRILTIDQPMPYETQYTIEYKKVWYLDKNKPEIYMKEYPKKVSEKYENCNRVRDLIGDDYSEEFLSEHFGRNNLDKTLKTQEVKVKLSELSEYWHVVEEGESEWVQNPGGIPGNVLSRLPSIVQIPAESCIDDLTKEKGSMFRILGELFEQVRTQSENYKIAQDYLTRLASELDPNDNETNFGKLLEDLNNMTHRLFPDSAVHVTASLDEPEKSIKPQFGVEMESNVRTPVDYQGHGMIRATVFQLLRYMQDFANRNMDCPRSTIFCFEEPEIFLDPSASNQMRDAIYELAGKNCQIVSTTHSPYMVNLGTEKDVSLCKMSFNENGFVNADTLNLNGAFEALKHEEAAYLKMLLKVDDYISRMFFTNKSVFVEGDTEEVVIRETLQRLSVRDRARVIGNMEFLRARGKPVLISIAKYLNALGLEYHLIHDRDYNQKVSEGTNAAIKDAAGEERVTLLAECMEHVLGYDPPSKEKPYTAYKFIEENWGDSFEEISETWKEHFRAVCSPYLD